MATPGEYAMERSRCVSVGFVGRTVILPRGSRLWYSRTSSRVKRLVPCSVMGRVRQARPLKKGCLLLALEPHELPPLGGAPGPFAPAQPVLDLAVVALGLHEGVPQERRVAVGQEQQDAHEALEGRLAQVEPLVLVE